MKKGMSLVAVMAVLANACLFGRPVRIPQPEELFEMADVVVNGEVSDFTLTDKRSELVLGANQPVKVRLAEARIKPLGVSKGNSAGELILEFPVYDTDSGPIVNGPILPHLIKGDRYRFYLKGDKGRYVSVLNDEFDSGFAVHRLAPEESDDSPPLFKGEAEKIAENEFRRFRPKPNIQAVSGGFNGSGWTFTFYASNPLSKPPHTCDAEIVVDGSRLINPKGFIGSQAPRVGSSLSEGDFNKPVRITVEGNFQDDDGFSSHPNEVTILYGRIDRVQGRSVFGTFASPAFRDTAARKLSFPLGKLASIQLLAVSPDPAK